MSGKGAYTFTDGTIYEGDFKNGLKEGQGRIIYPNGDLYEGEFKNDKMNGKGRLRTQNVYFEGFFKDDEIEGDVTLIDEEGKEHKGQLGNK